MTPEQLRKEREMFEVFAQGEQWMLSRNECFPSIYARAAVQKLWEGFLARAEIAAEAEAENERLRKALEHVVIEIRGQMNSREYSFQDKVYWGQVAGVGEAALAPKGAT